MNPLIIIYICRSNVLEHKILRTNFCCYFKEGLCPDKIYTQCLMHKMSHHLPVNFLQSNHEQNIYFLLKLEFIFHIPNLEIKYCNIFKTTRLYSVDKYVFFRSEIFFSDNTRVRIFIFFMAQSEFFFPEFNIRLYVNPF